MSDSTEPGGWAAAIEADHNRNTAAIEEAERLIRLAEITGLRSPHASQLALEIETYNMRHGVPLALMSRVLRAPRTAPVPVAVPEPTPTLPPVRRAPRRDVNGRMLAALQADPHRIEWSANTWAKWLKCADSSVKEAKAWGSIIRMRGRT